MTTERKTKQEAAARLLNERRGSFEVQTTLELLDLLLAGVKNNLITCQEVDFLKLQGEAQAYDKLIRLITRPSINLQNIKE